MGQRSISVCNVNDTSGILRDGKLVIYGLSREGARSFADKIVADEVQDQTPSDEVVTRRHVRLPRGRRLVLEPYLDLIRELIDQTPSITITQISTELRRRKVRFSQDKAIINLLNRSGLKLDQPTATNENDID